MVVIKSSFRPTKEGPIMIASASSKPLSENFLSKISLQKKRNRYTYVYPKPSNGTMSSINRRLSMKRQGRYNLNKHHYREKFNDSVVKFQNSRIGNTLLRNKRKSSDSNKVTTRWFHRNRSRSSPTRFVLFDRLIRKGKDQTTKIKTTVSVTRNNTLLSRSSSLRGSLYQSASLMRSYTGCSRGEALNRTRSTLRKERIQNEQKADFLVPLKSWRKNFTQRNTLSRMTSMHRHRERTLSDLSASKAPSVLVSRSSNKSKQPYIKRFDLFKLRPQMREMIIKRSPSKKTKSTNRSRPSDNKFICGSLVPPLPNLSNNDEQGLRQADFSQEFISDSSPGRPVRRSVNTSDVSSSFNSRTQKEIAQLFNGFDYDYRERIERKLKKIEHNQEEILSRKPMTHLQNQPSLAYTADSDNLEIILDPNYKIDQGSSIALTGKFMNIPQTPDSVHGSRSMGCTSSRDNRSSYYSNSPLSTAPIETRDFSSDRLMNRDFENFKGPNRMKSVRGISTKNLARSNTIRTQRDIDEALSFANTWADYLKRAIALRVSLRQEIRDWEMSEESKYYDKNFDRSSITSDSGHSLDEHPFSDSESSVDSISVSLKTPNQEDLSLGPDTSLNTLEFQENSVYHVTQELAKININTYNQHGLIKDAAMKRSRRHFSTNDSRLDSKPAKSEVPLRISNSLSNSRIDYNQLRTNFPLLLSDVNTSIYNDSLLEKKVTKELQPKEQTEIDEKLAGDSLLLDMYRDLEQTKQESTKLLNLIETNKSNASPGHSNLKHTHKPSQPSINSDCSSLESLPLVDPHKDLPLLPNELIISSKDETIKLVTKPEHNNILLLRSQTVQLSTRDIQRGSLNRKRRTIASARRVVSARLDESKNEFSQWKEDSKFALANNDTESEIPALNRERSRLENSDHAFQTTEWRNRLGSIRRPPHKEDNIADIRMGIRNSRAIPETSCFE
ncbi:hypothetical protein NADFUDRAFT_68382 [Nadsonia fulvescens var. elongata DSM 6958]|uniref:Uncharacterized protein n=1 Tax=Nadsonia fulvescens var. elongata DSM 6958 TaxID=857566 RepID=A0A1E3PTA7_9ASCO|nr:hypothetical protein NADFUDRAFT_68382 [Nadsonia fulvescens var. elongata DSM 6958]